MSAISPFLLGGLDDYDNGFQKDGCLTKTNAPSLLSYTKIKDWFDIGLGLKYNFLEKSHFAEKSITD